MSFRFYRRVNVAPGLSVNLSKGGASLSMGPRGAKVTVGRRGAHGSVGIPGTGVYYTKRMSSSRPRGRRPRAVAPEPERRPLTLGFFERLTAGPDKLALVEGLKALATGDEPGALDHFRNATGIADGAFLAGCLAAKRGHGKEAEDCIEKAMEKVGRLGSECRRFGVHAAVSYPVTPEFSVEFSIDRVGLALLGAEVYQQDGRLDEALSCVAMALAHAGDNLVVQLSVTELLLEIAGRGDRRCRKAGGFMRSVAGRHPDLPADSSAQFRALAADLELGAKKAYSRVVNLTQEARNASPVHACLLLYRARALRGLRLSKLAQRTLTRALRRKREVPRDLLQALHYERALAYAENRQRMRSRTELETVYSLDPGYRDVASRLGLD